MMSLDSRSRFRRVQRWALTNDCKATGLSGLLASTLGSDVEPRTVAVASTSHKTCSDSG